MISNKRLFDVYIAVDWSAKNSPSPVAPSKDAVWVGEKDLILNLQKETYFRTRFECINYLQELLISNVKQNKRTIIGYDLDFGFPAGFIKSLNIEGDEPNWKKMWNLLSKLIKDDEFNSNNRFEVASYLNSLCMDKNSSQPGPLWGCPVNAKYEYLNPKSPTYPFKTKFGKQLNKLRHTEKRESKAQPVWKLIGSASVGGQTLVGIPAIWKLRNDENLIDHSRIWPFETGFDYVNYKEKPLILHVEIWPGILSSKLDKEICIRDRAQVRATVDWMYECDESRELEKLLNIPEDLSADDQKDCCEDEGWVLGSGYSKIYKNPSSLV